MKFFSGLKAYLYAGIAALVTVLVAWLKVKDMQLDAARDDRDAAEADSKRGRDYIEAEVKIEKEFNSRSREIAKEIEETGVSKELNDPNDWEWENTSGLKEDD